MGSKISKKYPRMRKAEYEQLKNSLTREEFYAVLMANGNEAVCRYYNIGLGPLARLIKDFDIKLTEDEIKVRIKIATEQAIMEKYGVKSVFAQPEMQEKIKAINLEKYGVENPFAVEAVKEKIKQTCLERYGFEHASQADQIKEKVKATNLERYGVDNYAKTSECQNKMQQTCLNKYGRANVGCFGSPEYTEAMLKKYGTTHAWEIPGVPDKMKETNLQRYGMPYFSQTFEHQQQLRSRYIIGNETFDSLPELAVWLYHIDHNIPITRLPVKLEYEYEGKIHYYFPDFSIQGVLVEIKGDHFFNESGELCNPFDHKLDGLFNAKYQCGLQNGVEFWTSAKYNACIQYCKTKYNLEIFKVTKNKDE